MPDAQNSRVASGDDGPNVPGMVELADRELSIPGAPGDTSPGGGVEVDELPAVAGWCPRALLDEQDGDPMWHAAALAGDSGGPGEVWLRHCEAPLGSTPPNHLGDWFSLAATFLRSPVLLTAFEVCVPDHGASTETEPLPSGKSRATFDTDIGLLASDRSTNAL